MVSAMEMPEQWGNTNIAASPSMAPALHNPKETDENSSPLLHGFPNGCVMISTIDGDSSPQQRVDDTPQANGDYGVTGDRKVIEPLIVFDWDDTILTSSWIQVNDLLQAGSYDELPLEVRRELAQLERSVIKCLKNARRLGTVIIITNAESGWVELSAARFFVDVLPLLEGVPVVSARSLFESQFPGSPLCWKSAAFAYMMHDHFLDRPRWLQKQVVSIGDSNEEKVAMRIASGQHSTIAAKAVKFITGPDPVALSCQLDFVTKNLASVISSDSEVDIVLDASMIHGSCSLPLHSRGVYDDLQQLQQPSEAAASCSSSSSTVSSASASSGYPSSSCLPSFCQASATGVSCPSCTGAPRTRSAEVAPSFTVPPSSSGAEATAIEQINNSGSDGRGGATSARSPSSRPSSAPPSPQHLALKRRASSSPISIPSPGYSHGHKYGHVRAGGRGVEGAGKGPGSRGEEGGGGCAQPCPPCRVEISGSDSDDRSGDETALASSSLVRGGGGGAGAEGGGRSAFGGGRPCPVDDGVVAGA